MNYSQKRLIDLFKSGKAPGETGQPKHIETVISNVFLFDKKVYKFYKNNNDFFNKGFRDISDKDTRFSFTKKDFAWNRTLSPTIYTDLKGVVVRNDEIEFIDENKAEELVFVMNRINAEDVLFSKLISGKISAEDSYVIGKQFGESLSKAQTKIPNKNYYELYGSRIQDLRDWIKSVTEYISLEESGSYCDFLESFRNKNKEKFETQYSNEVTVDGDFHSHNAVYSNGLASLMDTYPPKEAWGIGHQPIAMYRIGTDIWALSGDRNLFENFVKGYEEGSGIKIDRSLDDLYIVYSSGIAVSYLYMLQRTDPRMKAPAEKFHAFIRNYFAKIKDK